MDLETKTPNALVPQTPEVAALAAQPWAYESVRLHAHFAALARITPEAIAQARSVRGSLFSDPEETPPYETRDGVASIAVSGTILQSVPEWFAYFGITATSTSDLRSALSTALADPAVTSVLFVIDSPGGTIGGLQELGDAIHAARGPKPIEAAIANLGASAAYWIAASAEKISATKTSEVGSIGVYSVMRDYSRAMLNAGIETHVVASGPLKGAGVFGAPIGERALEVMQEQINALCSLFEETVSRGRSLDAAATKAIATGRVWIASEAQRLGLIDTVASVDETHAALAKRAAPRGWSAGGMAIRAAAATQFASVALSPSERSSIVSATQKPATDDNQTAASAATIAELQKQLAAANAANEAAAKASAELVEAEAKRATELSERVLKLEEEQAQAGYLAKAKAMPNVVGLSTPDLATAMRCLEGGKPMPPAVAAKVVAAFTQINAVIAKSDLLREHGTVARDGGTAHDKLNAFAAEMRVKDPKLTEAQALTLACGQHPDLYREAQTLG